MTRQPSLDELWDFASTDEHRFDGVDLRRLPKVAQRYLEHSIAPGTPLASAVRLRMHGEIKLKSWHPFSAEQVIRWDRGMIWRASVRMHGIPIRGSDALVDCVGRYSALSQL